MSARIAAAAIAVAILTAAGVARADQRPVAVIDLVDNADSRQLAHAIGEELGGNPDLQQLPDPQLAASLIGDMTAAAEDSNPVANAKRDLDAAREALEGFAFADAERFARDGEGLLEDVTPATAAPLISDLAFALGRARLGQHDAKGAAAAFAMAYRLLPDRPAPDPARFLPEVVTAYDAAAHAAAIASGTVEVRAHGDAWIDGVSAGPAPGPFAITAGEHLVQVAGSARFARGQLVMVAAAGAAPVIVPLPDADAPIAVQVARARWALAKTADPTARAAILDQIAKLVRVGDAVILSAGTNGATVWQTWQDHAPGLSAATAVGNSPPRDLLAPLAPPHVAAGSDVPPTVHGPGEVGPKIPFTPIEPPPPWYRKRWVQVSVAAGVVAIVVGSILWAEHDRGGQPLATGIVVGDGP